MENNIFDNGVVPKNMKCKKFFERVVLGILMGTANMVPGVSGGTLALITGIYDRLVQAINSVPVSSPITLLKEGRKGMIKRVKDIDYPFLVPLCIGLLIATLSVARTIEYLLDVHTAVIYSFFMGLIVASVGVIYKYIEKIDATNILFAALGFFGAYLFLGMSSLETNHSPPMIFVAGTLAIITMVLPGISGAFMLVFLQQYDYMLKALNNMDIPLIVIFMAGGVTGLFGFSRIVEYLIERHRSITMSFLFGLMLGGLRVPINSAMDASPGIYEFVVPAAVGAAVVSILELKFIWLEE